MKPSYGLTDEEVERMLIESFEHAEADFEARLADRSAQRGGDASITRPRSRCAVRTSIRSPPRRWSRANVSASRRRWPTLKQAIGGADREAIQTDDRGAQPGDPHLAEVVMNRSVREALAGKNVKDV